MRTLFSGTARADFGYGNARLRARKASLLGGDDYEELLGKDVEGVLGRLSSTAYAPEMEGALTRFHGARRLHEAVKGHLVRSLEEMRSFYAGRARELVDILLSRWDLSNTVALLRGEATAPHTEEALANVVPIGPYADAFAREVARQNELAAAVGLMVRWKLPDEETARTLRSAWPDYERTEDLAALEQAVAAAWARRTADALESAGPAGETLRRYFAREIDEQNLLAALRLREALARRETDALPVLSGLGPYLPGGSAKLSRLDEAIRLPDPEAVANALADAGPKDSWRAPLERWGRTADLVALQAEIEARRVRDAVSLFYGGDPLGVDVPVAYAAAKENEARALRLIAEGASGGLPPERVRARLILTQTRSEA